MSNFKITSEPFDYSDNMAEIALEDLSKLDIRSQIIGNALAKLKLLEEQGSKVGRTDYKIVYEFLEKCESFSNEAMWWLTEEVYKEIMR